MKDILNLDSKCLEIDSELKGRILRLIADAKFDIHELIEESLDFYVSILDDLDERMKREFEY